MQRGGGVRAVLIRWIQDVGCLGVIRFLENFEVDGIRFDHALVEQALDALVFHNCVEGWRSFVMALLHEIVLATVHALRDKSGPLALR